jgi:cell division protease FtsH
MITQYGMGDTLGLLNMQQLLDLNLNQDEVIKECKTLIHSIYDDVKELLRNERHNLDKVTDLLIEKETLYEADLILD